MHTPPFPATALLERIAADEHKALVEADAAIGRAPKIHLNSELDDLERDACDMRASAADLIQSGMKLLVAAGQLESFLTVLRDGGKLR
jgi:acyl-coenzyme A synthetase/AMP-(fatty) acid ligase